MDTDCFFRIEAELDHISLVLGLNGHMDKCEEVEEIRYKLMSNTKGVTVEEAKKMLEPYKELADSIKID